MKLLNKIILFVIYAMHLLIYVFMTNIVKQESNLLINVYDKLNIPNEIETYSPFWLTIFIVLSLSIYLCIYLFDFNINKKTELLLLLTPFICLAIAIYKYYKFDFFITMLFICIGLNLSSHLMFKYTNIIFKRKSIKNILK